MIYRGVILSGRMGCTECGGENAEPTNVEYGDGTMEQVTLCSDCRREFEEGDLVAAVSIDT